MAALGRWEREYNGTSSYTISVTLLWRSSTHTHTMPLSSRLMSGWRSGDGGKQLPIPSNWVEKTIVSFQLFGVAFFSRLAAQGPCRSWSKQARQPTMACPDWWRKTCQCLLPIQVPFVWSPPFQVFPNKRNHLDRMLSLFKFWFALRCDALYLVVYPMARYAAKYQHSSSKEIFLQR